MMPQINIYPTFDQAIKAALLNLKYYGDVVVTESWQGIKQPVEMHELLGYDMRVICPPTERELKYQVKPDLPWADDHFLERVGGLPLNPGEQYKNWPGYKNKSFNDANFRNIQEKFSHTYMERYWPKYAGGTEREDCKVGYGIHRGIRFEYGDLTDVVDLLKKEPYTRQAYLPVWFPEDTGVKHGGRVPCTIGYHFIMRNNTLHIDYTLRACDAIRHFRNDIYLTVKLLYWVLQELRAFQTSWRDVRPGIFTMHIISFHCFKKELNLLL